MIFSKNRYLLPVNRNHTQKLQALDIVFNSARVDWKVDAVDQESEFA
jgi:hypothetical protein